MIRKAKRESGAPQKGSVGEQIIEGLEDALGRIRANLDQHRPPQSWYDEDDDLFGDSLA